MPDIADAIIPGNFRLQMIFTQYLTDFAGNLLNAVIFAAADIEDLAVRIAVFQCKHAGLGNVMPAAAIAPLPSIFRNNGRFGVKHTRREKRQYASIRIGKRLTRTVDIKKPQSGYGDVVGRTDNEA